MAVKEVAFVFACWLYVASATFCIKDDDCGLLESCCKDSVCRRTCYYCSYNYQCGTGECCWSGDCQKKCHTTYGRIHCNNSVNTTNYSAAAIWGIQCSTPGIHASTRGIQSSTPGIQPATRRILSTSSCCILNFPGLWSAFISSFGEPYKTIQVVDRFTFSVRSLTF